MSAAGPPVLDNEGARPLGGERRAAPPGGEPESLHEWLMSDRPRSRRQAAFGRAYGTWRTFLRNRLAMAGLAIVLGLVVGALVGAWQGFWVASVGIPAFIVTLAGMLLFRGLDLIWRRPEWLPPGSWTPGITFLQLAFDLIAATNWPSTMPQALAHDYRLEGPLAVDLAFGHHAPRARLAELADRLVADEVARGARIRALRRADGYTPSH